MTGGNFDQLSSMIDRADKLLAELEGVYRRDLAAKDVSAEALNITHEVIEKCSNVLDQAMTLIFNSQISPLLTTQPKRGGYFPVAKDEQSYRSTLGQWNASNLGDILPSIDEKLRALQPFTSGNNAVYLRIRELANKKHTELTPQKRAERQRVNVNRPGMGGVSWSRSGVRFGAGVQVMGVPIDPHTQMPVPSSQVEVTVETWVSFHLSDTGEDALAFCRSAIAGVRRVVQTLFS